MERAEFGRGKRGNAWRWREHADHFGVDLGEEAADATAGVEDVGDADKHLGELPLIGGGRRVLCGPVGGGMRRDLGS